MQYLHYSTVANMHESSYNSILILTSHLYGMVAVGCDIHHHYTTRALIHVLSASTWLNQTFKVTVINNNIIRLLNELEC